MKKTAIFFIALLAAGCVREVGTGRGWGRDGISLTPTTSSTRVHVTTMADLQAGGFTVYATAADAGSTGSWYHGIDGSNAHVYVDGEWSFQTPVVWPDDEALYPLSFYALYFGEAATPPLTAVAGDPAFLQASYTVAPSAADQVDVLAATAMAYSQPSGDQLAITFDHILSKVVLGMDNADVLHLGVMNAADTGTYDFVAGQWSGPTTMTGSGTLYDDEILMLMPQTSAAWVPVAGEVPDAGDGALIHAMYRLDSGEVGYASASDHPDFAGGYTGPLYVHVGFPLPADPGGDFTWAPGKGYIYDITVGEAGSSNGYLVDEYYFDVTGTRTSLRVTGGKQVGEMLNDGVIHVSLEVGGWDDIEDDITPPDPSAGRAVIPVSSGNLIWSKMDVAAGGGAFTASEAVAGGLFNWTAATSGGTGADGSVCPPEWRMPTAKELFNLINLYTGNETEPDFTSNNPGLASGVYTNVGMNLTGATNTIGSTVTSVSDSSQSLFFLGTGPSYWSSTAASSNTTYSWALTFNSARPTGGSFTGGKTTTRRVRCVQDPPVPNPVGEVAIPSADGSYTTIWAGSNLSAKGVFAASATDDGVYFQWGRNVAYPYNYGSALPASAADQIGNTIWPAGANPCPVGGWRVPTREEWERFLDVQTNNPRNSGDRTFTSAYGSITLPATGNIGVSGGSGGQGTNALYWSGTQRSNVYAEIFYWSGTTVASVSYNNMTSAQPVRCVRTAGSYRVAATANAGGTAKVTSDAAGTTAITQATEGSSVTFTATPAGGYGFAGWSFSGAGASSLDVNTLANPLTIAMPAGALTATATFGPATPAGELAIPHDMNGSGGAIWATVNLANNGTFAASETDKGALFQWGRGAAWAHPEAGVTIPDWPGEGTDQTSVETWPAATDPCPAPWRVPTQAEWLRFDAVMTDPLNSGDRLFAGANGNIYLAEGGSITSTGSATIQGVHGSYQSSEQRGISDALCYGFYWRDTDAAFVAGNGKVLGKSVRCVRDFPDDPQTVTIGSYTWAKRNVGLFGTFVATEADGGWLYAFGSAAMPTGNKFMWPGMAYPTPISSSNPGLSWPAANGGPGGQATSMVLGSWSNAGGWIEANDPCPTGFGVPSADQWQDLLDNSNYGTAIDQLYGVSGRRFTSKTDPEAWLFIPFSGARSNASGSLASKDYGYYNSSTPSGTSNSKYVLRIHTTTTDTSVLSGQYAIGLRCVKDTPVPNPVGEVPIPSADGSYTTVWAGSNLSATGVFATSATDDGVMFQWARNVAYTHPGNNAGVGTWPASGADQTGNSTWPEATNPCPRGWRVPTEVEWQRFDAVMADPLNSGDRTFTSSYGNITVPAAGYIVGGTGGGRNSYGRYWSSDQQEGDSVDAYAAAWTDSAGLTVLDGTKTGGYSVRCVRTQE